MKKPNLSTIFRNIGTSAKIHSPEILTGIGIAGMITTVVMAVKATPKALELMDDEVRYRLRNNEQDEFENIEGLIKVSGDDSEEYERYRLPIKDVIKITWLCYVPTTITGVVSVACLIGASSVNVRRNAALAAAYRLSESTLRDYREKVVETIGEKKEKEVRDAVAKEKVKRNPKTNNEVILTQKGDTLCYDLHSGRYFKSDIEKLRKAMNDLNRRMLHEDYISLNDFYDEIGLNNTKMGDDLGWRVDDGLIDISFSSHLSDDGTPCLAISYSLAPKYDYYHN